MPPIGQQDRLVDAWAATQVFDIENREFRDPPDLDSDITEMGANCAFGIASALRIGLDPHDDSIREYHGKEDGTIETIRRGRSGFDELVAMQPLALDHVLSAIALHHDLANIAVDHDSNHLPSTASSVKLPSTTTSPTLHSTTTLP